MADVTIYVVAENTLALTRAEWATVLSMLQGHPIIATIDANAPQVANTVQLTTVEESSVFALVSFVLPSALRPNLQGYAKLALGVTDISDPLVQYGQVFTGIAQVALATVTLTLIAYDEDHEQAVAQALAWLANRPDVMPIQDNPRGG